MALSPELQASADEIRRNKSLVKSLQAERDLWKGKALDSQAKLDEMAHKNEMSDEDREELKRQRDELDALNDELEGAAQDNTKPVPSDGSQASGSGAAAQNAQDIAEERGRLKEEGPAPVEPIQAPLMPTLAFDPAGTGPHVTPAGDGQPQQAPAIETAGGFVIQGGASTQRAPGSRPDSPSSSLIVPTDPNAKAAVSTADEVKSGLGDSTGNELIGNDGRPVSEGPGMPKEPTDAEREAAQKQADLAAEEMARREANPLNLSPEDLQKRQDEERAMEQAKNDAQQGKPNADTGPAPSPQEAKPETGSPATDRAADGGEKRGE